MSDNIIIFELYLKIRWTVVSVTGYLCDRLFEDMLFIVQTTLYIYIYISQIWVLRSNIA